MSELAGETVLVNQLSLKLSNLPGNFTQIYRLGCVRAVLGTKK